MSAQIPSENRQESLLEIARDITDAIPDHKNLKLMVYREQKCSSPEAFKAWSQNLGHEKVLTTFYSYGEVDPERQRNLIKDLWIENLENQEDVTQILEKLLARAKNSKI